MNLLSSALITSLPEKSPAGKKFWKFIKSLRPVISFDALTGTPQVTLDLRPGESEKSIESLFQFLEQQPGPVLLAIDEFQQILNFLRRTWMPGSGLYPVAEKCRVYFLRQPSAPDDRTFLKSLPPFLPQYPVSEIDRIDRMNTCHLFLPGSAKAARNSLRILPADDSLG